MALLDNKQSGEKGLRKIGIYALFVLGGTVVIWLCLRFASLIVAWSLYSRFFEKVREVGGLPDFLSGAIAIWCVVIIILFVPILTFSVFVKRSRKVILMSAGAFSLWMVFLYGLSIQQSKNLFNPMTGTTNYNYARDTNGNIKLFPRDYSFDPENGVKLQPLNAGVVAEYQSQAAKDALLAKTSPQQRTAPIEAAKKEGRVKQTEAGTEVKSENPEIKIPSPATASPESKPTTIPIQPRNVETPPVVTAQAEDFLFVIKECVLSGTKLHCSGYVDNKDESAAPLWLDDLGEQHQINSMTFGAGCCFQKLEPNLPVNFSLTTENLKASVEKINLILKYSYVDRGSGGGRYSDLAISNIPLSKR